MNWPAPYLFGRVFAVVVRPLCLFVANNYLSAAAAQGMAIAFLSSALSMVAVAAGPHKAFYTSHFAEHRRGIGLAFYVYISSVSVLLLVGCMVAFGIALAASGSLVLGILSAGYFASEKLADELLRFRFFERNFDRWGRSNIARSFLQIVGLALLIVFAADNTPIWLAVCVLLVANLLVFVPQLPGKLIVALRRFRSNMKGWLIRRAVRSLRTNWNLWAIALFGSSIGYIDRILALILDKQNLAVFSLVVMCFSIMQMTIDFFCVSRYRRDFLDRRISIGSALMSREFIGSLSLGLAASTFVCFVLLTKSNNAAAFPLSYIFVIAVLQSSMAIVAVPSEILYWSHLYRKILLIDLGFWISLCLSLSVLYVLEADTLLTFVVAAICAIARLVFYLVVASRIADRVICNPISS